MLEKVFIRRRKDERFRASKPTKFVEDNAPSIFPSLLAYFFILRYEEMRNFLKTQSTEVLDAPNEISNVCMPSFFVLESPPDESTPLLKDLVRS